ncbi:MAG: NADH-quinone oxidoreductase subunit NuoI, partial [Nitrospirae bacterium]|nr:NADH-quinone oxidoreductase subunit NuoI [Nitrospirota bacterium]
DRNFPEREKKLEFQHPNVAYFNIGHKNLPHKAS